MVKVIHLSKKHLLNDLQQGQLSASRDSLSKVTVGPRKFFNRFDSLPIAANNFKDTQETIITPQQSVINSKRQSHICATFLSSNESYHRVTPFYFKKPHSSTNASVNGSSTKSEKKNRRRRRCGPFLLSKLCCCSLAATILGILGLSVTIAAMILSGSPTSTVTSSTVSTLPLLPLTSVQNTTLLSATTSVSTATTRAPFNSTFNTNLLINGDAETGPCQTGSGITPPTGWNYNGTITQVSYNNPMYGDLSSTDPGPSDRGQCYFFGQISMITTMWQTVNLTNTIDPVLIDNYTVQFNLSAWLGGWSSQNDNAQVSVSFADQTNHVIGTQTTIGPVLAAARGDQSSLLFRQANGLVPVGTRSLTVLVTITCIIPTSNDGDVDNISIYLY